MDKGDIQIAYEQLLKYVMALKVHFQKVQPDSYTFGNVYLGFMDYTYFYFFNDFLRSKKLRFGIVLNHPKMQFELWLLGQNAEVQSIYWELLKITKWNAGRTAKPKYAVLEAVLIENPDFNDLDALSDKIGTAAQSIIQEIMPYLQD
nr:hypothetical protein [Aequitasia blattaphilus]